MAENVKWAGILGRTLVRVAENSGEGLSFNNWKDLCFAGRKELTGDRSIHV